MYYVGEKIYITPLSKSNIGDNYKNWLIDPEVTMFNSHGKLAFTDSDIEDFIGNANNEHTITWTIHSNLSKKHIGNTALQKIDYINRSAELAILIGIKDWGKGIGTEACELVLFHGFIKLNLNKIWLGTVKSNIGMNKIAKNLKMELEGTLKEGFWSGTSYIDILRYGILKKDWCIHNNASELIKKYLHNNSDNT